VLRVRAAGKKDRIVTIAGVNLAYDSLRVGIGQSVGLQAVKAIGKIEATASTVEKNVTAQVVLDSSRKAQGFGEV
jgi:hypothetical protein